jgi:hypothetical protein
LKIVQQEGGKKRNDATGARPVEVVCYGYVSDNEQAVAMCIGMCATLHVLM